MKSLNSIALTLQRALKYADSQRHKLQQSDAKAEKIHVVSVGGTLTQAYEQLRNAAENAEESLLLQRAIRRFYKRSFITLDDKQLASSGEGLITELTLAGYLKNDSVPVTRTTVINQLVRDYARLRTKLEPKIDRRKLDIWTLDVMSVHIESLFNDKMSLSAFIDFAYNYFLETLEPEKLFGERPSNYEVSLFVAVQRALLKFDVANSRLSLLIRYQTSLTAVNAFKITNEQLDEVLTSKITDQLTRIVDRHGAPFRILLRAMDSDENFATNIAQPKIMASITKDAITTAYNSVAKSVNRGIIRSVVFLIITKFLIGIAIEVPYDLLLHDAVRMLPLAVNLAFPPLYMILLRLTLMMPSATNSKALSRQIDHILYDPKPIKLQVNSRGSRSFGVGYNIAYGLAILAVFGGVGYGLIQIGFEWVHLVIFFIFISTASFLGFRLSRLIREIEIVDDSQNGVTIVRDFLYMPFVAVGRWMSEKYAQYNVISMMLDMFIELPLKTVLHIVRQWGAFVSAKKDEM